MRRREAVLGLMALGGCAAPAARAPLVVRPSPPSRLRLPAGAPFEAWAEHLHLPAMRASPQIVTLSGGGEDGAFGAGVMNGWSARGGRPRFDVVTGVSTGTLMAPFVFLGPRYDPLLRAIYTGHGGDELVRSRGLPGFLGTSLNDPGPMRRLIAAYVTSELVARVAEAHGNGRRLFAVTSNLDTGRADVWNMGRIARAGQVDLFRAVLLASASIPGFFPPVTLRAGNVREAHVDGGVNMQLLAVPEAAFRNLSRTRKPGGTLRIVVNNSLNPRPWPVPRSTLPIMQSTFSSMVRAHAASAVASARRYARRTGLDFAVASVGRDFDVPFDPSKRFELGYMRALYAYGYDKARSGNAWKP